MGWYYSPLPNLKYLDSGCELFDSDIWLPELWVNKFLYFKPPSLWSFITAALTAGSLLVQKTTTPKVYTSAMVLSDLCLSSPHNGSTFALTGLAHGSKMVSGVLVILSISILHEGRTSCPRILKKKKKKKDLNLLWTGLGHS